MEIAYLVMEVGVHPTIKTYSGGLGILAGDTAYALADRGTKAVFVTLLHRKGFARQEVGPDGDIFEKDDDWRLQEVLVPLDTKVSVGFEDRSQTVRLWEYRVEGAKGKIPVIFLDPDVEGNDEQFRRSCDRLYGDHHEDRLKQTVILGIGGYRALRALGYRPDRYHLNDDWPALVTVELLSDLGDAEHVRNRCVFTTHTPVASGLHTFPLETVKKAMSQYSWFDWDGAARNGELSLTHLAASHSSTINAVSLRHRYVAERALAPYPLLHVTNGVHHPRWIGEPLRRLLKKYADGWKDDPSLLARAPLIPAEELLEAHRESKMQLVRLINQDPAAGFKVDALMITVARRFTGYKRNTLILKHPQALLDIAEKVGEVQLLFAGKAHPADGWGRDMIREVLGKSRELRGSTEKIRVTFLPNYGIDVAQLLVQGSDVWLNNPRRPLEASGTSGMKAGLNGVLNFSVWDGWWLECGIDGVNGWGIGPRPEWTDLSESNDTEDLEDMLRKLGSTIVPRYYGDTEAWVEMMQNGIATIGPRFTAHRMVAEYFNKIYAVRPDSNGPSGDGDSKLTRDSVGTGQPKMG